MTITAPSTTVTVGAYTLGCERGELTLDTSQAPHVTGTVEVSVNPATLAALDPRQSTPPRVVVTVSAGIPRAFDLGVRERKLSHDAAIVTLTLASDEALLNDYAPLADDATPRQYEASLRGVVNYVLGKIGASLQAGGPDANVTAYWAVTNLLTNPSLGIDLTGWAAVQACTLSRYTGGGYAGGQCALATVTGAGTAVVRLLPAGQGASVAPGKVYTFDYYSSLNPVVAPSFYARIHWVNNQGQVIGLSDGPATTATNSWQRAVVTAKAPQGAARAEVFVIVPGVTTAGHTFTIDAGMLHEGEPVPYFDGTTTATAAYTYGWSNGAHVSTSYRTPAVERRPEALTWTAGESGMAFLLPLVQANGLRLVCDEQRRWTLRDETYQASGTITLRDAVNVVDADETISRDAGYWYDAQVTRYRWTDGDGQLQERVDAYALPGYSRVRLLDIAAAYPGPGRSEYSVRRAQGIGREVTITAQADWTATVEQAVSTLLQYAPQGAGRATRVAFDLTDDRMTITARTVDLQPGAIDLLVGTVDALAGTVNGL